MSEKLPFKNIDAFDAEFCARVTPSDWQRILAMRNHPRFLDGVVRYGALIPPFFAGKLVLNKIVTEVWRIHTLAFALHLHETRQLDDPRSGLTMTRLQKLCQTQEIASPGRVAVLVGLMQLGGYLRRVPSRLDARLTLLEPTDKLISIVQGWSQVMMAIVDAIEPESQFEQRHIADPRFGPNLRLWGINVVLDGWRLVDPWPEVMHFVARDAAWMMLLSLISPVIAAGDSRAQVVSNLDLLVFGKSYGVSRSHLRRVLDMAFEAGLLAVPPRNGSQIVLSHRLVCAYLTCIASELDVYRASARAAAQLQSGQFTPQFASDSGLQVSTILARPRSAEG